MGYMRGRIEELRAELEALHEADGAQRELSKQQAVKLLARTIFAFQRNGYTLQAIARLLSERGLEIRAATLGNYVRRLRRRGQRGRKEVRDAGRSGRDPLADRAARPEPTLQIASAPPAPAAAPRPDVARASFVAREDSDEI